MTNLLEKANKLKPYIVKIRRELHACPELGFQEYKTSRIIQKELKKLGIPYKVMAKTGIVALIKGALPGKVIAVRADMDALPVVEETGVPFASRNKGMAHSCGHDAHVAGVLGLAKLLTGMKKEIKGSVKLLFQPCEEMGEVKLDGAMEMVKAGAMKNPVPGAVIGLHVHPPMHTGTIELNYGKLYANADIFEIKVRGVGGHGAVPQKSVDPLLAAAAIILNLQSIVARNISPLNSAVVSVTMIKAGEATNVIPPEAHLLGTVRSLDNETQKLIIKRMKAVVNSTAKVFGARAWLKYTVGYPFFSNDPKLTGLVENAAGKILGKKNVHIATQPSMGGENFGHFAKKAPGCFFNLGIVDGKKSTSYALHNPKFNIDENALPLGTAVLAQACFDFLDL